MKRNITKGVITEIVEDLEKKSDFMSFLEFDESKSFKEDMNISKTFNINKHSYEDNLVKAEWNPIQTNRNEMIKNQLVNSLHNMKLDYEKIIKDESFAKTIKKLKEIETKIIQLRCILHMEIKLTTLIQKTKVGEETEYILARAPFYRPGYKRQEISVYLGKTEDLGKDLEILKRNTKFMKKAEEALFETMVKETAS